MDVNPERLDGLGQDVPSAFPSQLQQRIFIMAIATVVRTFDKVALTLFNTAVLGGLPLVAAALVASSFAG